MAKRAGVRRPTKPRVPMQGGMAKPYEAPVRTSGTPRSTKTAGKQKFMNVSETKPGSGTSADGTTARRPRD